MAKPKPLQIPSDDCEVTIDGKVYRTHEGEWVQLYPCKTVADQKLARKISIIQADLLASQGDPDEGQKQLDALDEVNDAVCRKICETLVAWSWTDDRGKPLPQPTDDPKDLYETVLALRQEEVMYLYNLAVGNGTAEAERKNGSRPSQTSAVATRPRPNRK